jgi:hypothetical protein
VLGIFPIVGTVFVIFGGAFAERSALPGGLRLKGRSAGFLCIAVRDGVMTVRDDLTVLAGSLTSFRKREIVHRAKAHLASFFVQCVTQNPRARATDRHL